MVKIRKQEALDYHSQGKKGKIEVIPTKPYSSQRDLSLAYSPGVAEPCLEIAKNVDDAYKYTAKGNLVAVISNGTAVLGLGDIGPEASKPVMEGKGLLFKIFADIDVFDIEVDATDVDKFVEVVKAIAPTFGGINLEDIKAPEAFEIEQRLKDELDIPVMHDDQHGTAIISAAALINALELANKKIGEIKVVVNGAGASATSCAKLYLSLGVKKENLTVCDSKGVIRTDRETLSKSKEFFATNRDVNTLDEAIKNADVFLGLSKGNVVSKDMIASMAADPIVFALANPNPEIPYADAISVREDLIMATGRSDHPNQVNNVLGFPYIFRGAIDVRATSINEEMKLAAVQAIAELAKETVPEEVVKAYGVKNLAFGRGMIIPKPLDPRLITYVAPAVAKAAMESGVAKHPIQDWDKYKKELNERLGLDNKLMRNIAERALKDPKRVVFTEADNFKILKAAQTATDDGIITPILLGDKVEIQSMIEEFGLDFGPDVQIIDPRTNEMLATRKEYGAKFFDKRKRKGITMYEAVKLMRERNYFGSMLVEMGLADAMISGISRKYKDVIGPALQVIGTAKENEVVAGMYIINTKKGPIFFADTTVNLNPTAEEIAEITLMASNAVQQLGIKPRVALLSYSNFGSAKGDDAEKMAKAAAILHKEHPELVVDGDIQANFALNRELIQEKFEFSTLSDKGANTLIFPNLSAGNIAYKLVQELSEHDAIGPILLGMNKSVHILQLGATVREITNMIKVAVVDAQTRG